MPTASILDIVDKFVRSDPQIKFPVTVMVGGKVIVGRMTGYRSYLAEMAELPFVGGQALVDGLRFAANRSTEPAEDSGLVFMVDVVVDGAAQVHPLAIRLDRIDAWTLGEPWRARIEHEDELPPAA